MPTIRVKQQNSQADIYYYIRILDKVLNQKKEIPLKKKTLI